MSEITDERIKELLDKTISGEFGAQVYTSYDAPIIRDLCFEVRALRQKVEKYRETLEGIRDLARTDLAPDAFNFSSKGQWDEHRMNKIAHEAAHVLQDSEAK